MPLHLAVRKDIWRLAVLRIGKCTCISAIFSRLALTVPVFRTRTGNLQRDILLGPGSTALRSRSPLGLLGCSVHRMASMCTNHACQRTHRLCFGRVFERWVG
jgi:hypothetical protein